MSVLPYGLIIRTLHANISVWWAIQTGKAANGADFIAPTQQTTFGTIVSIANPQVGGSGIWSGTTTTTYSGGPFIILQKDAQKAFNAWYSWQQNPSQYYLTVDPSVYTTVTVHLLTQDTTMDIRHKIYTRPVIGVSNLDGNAPTQTAMMGCIYQDTVRQCPRENGYGWGDIFGNGAAGCTAFHPQDHAGLDWNTHYKTFDCGSSVAALTDTTCLTTFSEPHWEWNTANGPSYIVAMKNFIRSGANFFAQCASTQSYENQAGTVGTGTFMSSFGLAPVNPSDGVNPPTTLNNYPDLPCAQYVGYMSSAITGAVPDFYNQFSQPDAEPGSWSVPPQPGPTAAGEINWYPLAFPIVTNIIDSSPNPWFGRNLYVASSAKFNNIPLGANVWYFGGHTWAGQAITGTENGRRFFFNAMIVPAARPPACGFTFCTATDICPPQDACHTCACDAQGNGFVQTVIPGCCLNNAACSGTCQSCDLNTHTCATTQGCCNIAAGINCTGSCASCVSGQCQTVSGCCTTNAQCGTGPCNTCQGSGVTSGCVHTPEPQCCDPSVTSSCSSSPCQSCQNNTCQRIQPVSTCCLANVDCGSTACDACNTATHTCYKLPGCCAAKVDCEIHVLNV